MTVAEGIDPAWLKDALRREPVRHSFAAWDVQWERERARFVSCRVGGATVGYLLIWLGDPTHPVVHWVGDITSAPELAPYLPARPLTVAAPEEIVPLVQQLRGPASWIPILRLTVRPTAPVPGSEDPRVRALGPADAARLRTWAQRHVDPLVQGYSRFDPQRHTVWGAFEGAEIVGAAFASVRLPEVWTLNGIFVEESARGHGLGLALTAHAVEGARRAGALAHLNVRETNRTARRVYERLGFQEYDRLAWIEAVDAPRIPEANT